MGGFPCTLGPFTQLDPGFDARTYGHSQLSTLIRAKSKLFEVKDVKGEDGNAAIYVRLKENRKDIDERYSRNIYSRRSIRIYDRKKLEKETITNLLKQPWLHFCQQQPPWSSWL